MTGKPGFEHRDTCRAARRNLLHGRHSIGNTNPRDREALFIEAAMAMREGITTKRAAAQAKLGMPERLQNRLEAAIRSLTGEIPKHATIMHPKTRIADHGRPEER